MKDLPTFKCRASALGQIMTNDRSGKSMGQTAKTYAESWVKEQLYGRRREFSSKFTEKGTVAEGDAIEYASDAIGWGLVSKNDKHFEDDHFTGTPDLILADTIVDIKCPWDCFKFPLWGDDIDKGYEWQLRAYMHLTGRSKAMVCYVLMDAPEKVVESEAWRLIRASGESEMTEAFYEQVRAHLSYSDLPQHLRLRTFEIEADPIQIALAQTRVEHVREYIAALTK